MYLRVQTFGNGNAHGLKCLTLDTRGLGQIMRESDGSRENTWVFGSCHALNDLTESIAGSEIWNQFYVVKSQDKEAYFAQIAGMDYLI